MKYRAIWTQKQKIFNRCNIVFHWDSNRKPWKREKHCSILLDLAKAFNSILLKIFLKKAECFNFSESAVTLLKSFLDERSQCVKLGTEVSEHFFVNHEVPQGTVLGPLILLSTTTIFQKNQIEFELVRFADDTSILCWYEPGETIATKIENILLKTDSYLKENQLTLKADKTKLLHVSTRDELEPKVILKEF